jgi:hypothetical protein
MKPETKVVAIRLPIEVVEIAEKNAAMLGVSLNMLLSNIVVTGLGCEMLEHGLLGRIMREALAWMKEHGHPDAPVPPVLPNLPPLRTVPKVEPRKRRGKK